MAMNDHFPWLRACLWAAVFSPWLMEAAPFALPADCRQLITGRAPDWNSSEATLQRWERAPGRPWSPVGSPVPSRLGKNGLAWGRGLHPTAVGGLKKIEGDGRAPAGVFAIGGAYGYAPEIARRPDLPYHQVTPSDLWVEDTSSPDYNRHLTLPGGREPSTEWEKAQQMRQGDPAHSLKLFIAHNASPGAVPGAGSAIFFHIWREGGAKASFGCTVLDESALKAWVAWVDPSRRPLYVLLPEDTYQYYRGPWGLP
jgi:L,D-peptidoglycan transpeptidase YkuD (ErfK/YbiS/YcfS/YnhG family)